MGRVEWWNPMVPELLVADLPVSRAFYCEVLGFSVRYERGVDAFAYLSLGGAQLMLEADHPRAWRTGPVQAPRGRGVDLQIEVPDATAVRDVLLAAGHPLFEDLVERRYAVDQGEERALEVMVQDPDGYLLRLVQPLGEALPALARRQVVSSGAVWEPVVGYSRAVRVDAWVAVAGTTAAAEGGGAVGGQDAGDQTREALRRITAALEEVGAGLGDVVRTRIYLTDITCWEEVGRVHGEVFAGIRPATSMVQVSALIDPALLVEVEADAVIT